ncbi:angiogenic factor with G patch and FHA domains 1 isoform X2 [Parasteatoda tepidariorum]|uniref:angiogenic factor with G patch and FHA domains 1 isoform X2 n=1 Tax=Parasteatoda tepidariorum TaxID=114398 RepID=UPI001C723E47|nr:angiogenic factor with G patch and FHA domains 1 isoform X3 [Parasteatoda tepidariorum]XP_042903505.1 angiogenic factor with G patch and FHA domains 1 isoform X3 [Parasteatoda tepidariorum]XP_042903506.1 angiogenic factor with G patch and FHA domains 1 isoform X3 [Parasteatoda tepidariorum]
MIMKMLMIPKLLINLNRRMSMYMMTTTKCITVYLLDIIMIGTRVYITFHKMALIILMIILKMLMSCMRDTKMILASIEVKNKILCPKLVTVMLMTEIKKLKMEVLKPKILVNLLLIKKCFLQHMLTETCDVIKEEKTYLESQKEETFNEVSNVWGMPVGSKQTIHDLVREVAEQNSGISDYIYDEKYQMYYSTSTGYYYDAIRKLLYDPQSGIYYKYDEDTSSYDFYYQVDLNTIETAKKSKQENVKVKARRRYWRKKFNVDEEKCSDSTKYSVKIDEQEGNYSSPEEGELFSSESDQESDHHSETHPFLENSSDNYSPCIRAIVKESTKLKIGTLLLITCSGAIIGRDKANDVYIPEIGVSKTHAEVSFNNELWKYVIKDLGSQNGTFVNDSRLSEPKELSSPCVLSHRDIVSIGDCKLMFHIHVGHETCDECEPGLVMAEKSLKAEKSSVYKTKEEKEKERRQEVRRLKKKYGLQSMGYEEVKNSTISGYEDKAEVRRKTVGSENPYEKTEASSLERSVNESNKGYQMLKKLGWKEGDSLGVTGLGISEPVPLRPWLSKAGLGSSEEHQTSMLTVAQDKRNKKWVLAQERFLKLT